MSDEGMSDAHLKALAGLYKDADDSGMESKWEAIGNALCNAYPLIIARLDASERERDHYRKLAFGRIDQSAANGWMPIACAPTNGSKIDLWSESHYGNGRIPDAWYVGNEWFVLNGNGRPEAIAHHHNVTHWRPIHALTANHSAPVVEE